MPPRKHTEAIDGTAVRQIRDRMKITQAALADQAHISRAYLIAIEQGQRDRVSTLVIEAIAAGLSVDPQVLILPAGSPVAEVAAPGSAPAPLEPGPAARGAGAADADEAVA